MGCPRPGKECNEFMCSLSINGICYNEDINKKSPNDINDMEWNVYFHDYNKNKIVTYNIFKHRKFNEEVQKLIKGNYSKGEFIERLKRELMYFFWLKCEYKIFISPCVGRNKEEAEVKIDIYNQVMLNFDRFVDYCWSFKEE